MPLMAWYLNQKTRLPFLPSNVALMSGSKLKRFFLTDSRKLTAGALREKVGIMDMPLVVTPISPEKPLVTTTLSFFCALADNVKIESAQIKKEKNLAAKGMNDAFEG